MQIPPFSLAVVLMQMLLPEVLSSLTSKTPAEMPVSFASRKFPTARFPLVGL
jgi:hypothetical protein